MKQRRRFATNASAAASRAALASFMGTSFGGKRDLYAAAGYEQAIAYTDYLERYLRQGLAKRVVNIFPDETWRKPPVILDGIDEPVSDTDFCLAWKTLAEGGQNIDGETRKGLLHYLHRLDRLAGIGTYGVMLFGLKDNKPLEQPVDVGSAQGLDSLLYINVFEAGNAVIAEIDQDRQSPRYGKPILYRLKFKNAKGQMDDVNVHWSRVVHITDNELTDDTLGTPRLEGVWNYLFDLDKIMAATGEAGWHLMDPGHVISTKDGYELPVIDDNMSAEEQARVTKAIADQEAQIDAFVHGLRRWLQLEGQDVETLSGQLQDPSGAFDVNVTSICATIGVPKRIFLGNEAGDLASSTDEKTWAKAVSTRQQNYAGPMILTPVLNRLLWYGVLPQPKGNGFTIRWQSLLEMDRKEQSQIADTSADALAKAGVDVDPVAFVQTYMPDLPADKVTKKAATTQPQGGMAANAAPFRWLNYP